MAFGYCEHPDEQVEVRPTNSMWGGAECYCPVCGYEWHMTQKECDAYENYIFNPPLRTLEDLEDEDASV